MFKNVFGLMILVDFPNTQIMQGLFVDSSGCVVGSGRDRYTTSDASWG